MPDESGFPEVTWHLDADTVGSIWRSTRQVFGNALWHGDMSSTFPWDLQQEIERRGGDFFNVAMDAAQGYEPGRDPSLIYPAFQQAFARFGVDLDFAPHPRHGDVLARARDIDAGRPAPGPDTWVFDAETVEDLWSAVEDDNEHLTDFLYDDFLDDLEMASGEQAFLTLSTINANLPEDADPSLWFRGLHKMCAGFGIEVGFDDHPEHGDVLARAAKLTASNIRRAKLRARIKAGDVLLIPLGTDDAPAEPDDAALRRDPRDTVLRARDGSGIITRRRAGDRAPAGLDTLAADGTVRELIPTGPDGYVLSATLTPDGRYALYIPSDSYTAGQEIRSIDLATGTRRPVLEGHLTEGAYDAVQALDDHRLLVKTQGWLAVYPLTDGLVTDPGAAFGTRHDNPGPALGCVSGSVVVVSSDYLYKPALSVFAVGADRIDLVAKVTGGKSPVNVFDVREVGDRVLVSRAPIYELVNLGAAARRHADWAATLPRAADAYLREAYRWTSNGVNEANDAVRRASFWTLTGPRGQVIAKRHDPDGDELVVGGDTGVSGFEPPVRLPAESDWRPDGRAILVTRARAIAEADLVTRQVREVHPGPIRGVARYTPRGFAALDGDDLVLYHWAHGSADRPTEAARIPVEGAATALAAVRDGQVLLLTGADWTALLATDGDRVYPIGALATRNWYSWWDHDGATYAMATEDIRRIDFKLVGIAEAVVAALAGTPADRIDLQAQRRLITSTLDYPHSTKAMFTAGHIDGS